MSNKNTEKKVIPIKEDKNNDNKSNNNENIPKVEPGLKDEYPKEKINKPIEFKNFDAITHFKQNIIHFDKNCWDQVKDNSQYCFTCKRSFCNECKDNNHKDHLLIQRDSCLNYDKSLFNEISKVIEKGIIIDNKKDQIKKDIQKCFVQIKESLDNLEKEKLKELDNIFKDLKSNFINLKDNYLKTKECIENYYKDSKKFFNIKIKKGKQRNLKLEENNKKEENEKNNLLSRNKSEINYLNSNEYEIGPNRDLENTVFLMQFELVNLIDNKNLQILDISNEINMKIKDISNIVTKNTNSIIEYIKKNFLQFELKDILLKFDDFYWDIKLRCQKYTQHISQFQNTIYDIYKKNGSLEKLKDLLCLFDSKNNKGKDILFNQQFFIKMNDISSLNKNIAKNLPKKIYLSNGKVRTNSKNRFMYKTTKTIQNEKKDDNNNTNNISNNDNINNKKPIKTQNNTKPNDKLENDNIEKSDKKEPGTKFELKKSHTNLNRNIHIPKKENIILNQRLIQRFYAYSILDFYTKYFKVNINNSKENENELDKSNIYIKPSQKNNYRYNSAKNLDKNDKKSKSINKVKLGKNQNLYDKYDANKYNNLKNLKNKENFSASSSNLNDLKNKQKSKFKSVSLLSNYSERYTELKEKVKPIINTNYLQLFDPMTTKITKIKIPLTKEEHGYTTFPDGCRHLLIDSDLYITGGTDNCGYPINIVLMYNVSIGEMSRITNLNDNHSYHSIEYLENFDSIIVVGGENSSSCEIMDLDSKKWTKLPSLNYPRANANIYYNTITSDLFVLFGMEGEMTEKTKNTDVIEVLELNDIIGGWMMVDYYKSVGLDLKNNYCITLPFTRDKLLVYGGSSARSIEKRMFAIFDMIKNECIKVDSETMDLIKLEENKIRAFDNAIEKMTV